MIKKVWTVVPINPPGYGDVSYLIIVALDKEEAFLIASEIDQLEFPVEIVEVDLSISKLLAMEGLDL